MITLLYRGWERMVGMIPHWKRKFVTLWTGQALSILSSSISQYALIWYLTDLTGSSAVLAMATMAAAIRYNRGDTTQTFFLRTFHHFLLRHAWLGPGSAQTSMMMGSTMGLRCVLRYKNRESSSFTFCFKALQSRTRCFAQSSSV